MNTNHLPEDPLLTMGASPNDYPENQGMGAAVGRHMEEAQGCTCPICAIVGPPVMKRAVVENGRVRYENVVDAQAQP